MMGSPTPFPANLYNHITGNMALPHRVLNNQAFPTNNLPHNFHLSFQQTSRPQPISPNRGLIAASNSQGLIKQRTNPLTINTLTAPNHLANIGSFNRHFNDIGGSGQGGPSLDYSQFPSLSVRPSSHNQVMPARNYVSMVSKQEASSEFQIQQEDFPALPGAQNPNIPTSFLDNSIKQTSYEGVKEGGKSFADKTVGQRRGIQTHQDGTLTNVPSSMVGDQFGMVGLLTFIRAADTDPNLVALAPGIDLTTLGLNLNQSEALYTCFQSPWSDLPCRPQDIDYHVPTEYHTNMYVRDKLAPLKLAKYNEDLLFFLFYLYGGDLLQLAAAAELYNRDWRYHKEERLWMTRAPGMEPTQKSREHERGTYFFFDSAAWRKVAKEFHLEYSKLEDRPQLPDSLFSVNNNPNNNPTNTILNSNTNPIINANLNSNNPTTTNNNNLTNNFLALNNNSNFINNYNNFNSNNSNTFFNISNNNGNNNFVGFNNNPPNSTNNNLTTSRPNN